MKKQVTFGICAALCIALCACGSSGGDAPAASTVAPTPTPTPEPPVLVGSWTQVDGNSEDSYMVANVEGETIEVDWCFDGGETVSLYWAGSYEAPTTADEPYTWESVNDKDKTGMALLASSDDTKTFTYEGGEITFKLSAMGTTTTVHMAKD